MALYRIECVVCPWCEAQSGKRVDHLYANAYMPVSFGPWYCAQCSQPFSGMVNAPGDVVVSKCDRARVFARTMALLKFNGKDGPVFFVMEFEEDSFQTIWLCDCVAAIHDGNCDPHEILEFVRAVDVSSDFNEDDDQQWPLLFPEAFAAGTIDGTATEVSARAITGPK